MKKWFFITTFQLEIGLKFLSAVGAGHKHPSDMKWKTQLLAALSALLDSMFLHELKGYAAIIFKKELLPSKGIVIILSRYMPIKIN